MHAVAVGSSFEPIVLKTIASLGGGSVRQISGEQTPQEVAVELLGEIDATRPSAIWRSNSAGCTAAASIRNSCPTWPAGTQQILLGRYLPEGSDQKGEVIVTGTVDGQPLPFKSPVSLADAEHGNSFIPRLWARMHLDALLEQGSSQAIKDEIIALSRRVPHHHALHVAAGAGKRRGPRAVQGQARASRCATARSSSPKGRDKADYELLQTADATGRRLADRPATLGLEPVEFARS